MFFDYSILNELKRVPTDAPEDETDKYNLDNEDEPENPEEDKETNYELDDETENEDDTEEESDYNLDDETESESEEDVDYNLDDEPEEEPEEGEEDTGYDLDDESEEGTEEPNDDEGGYDLDDETGEDVDDTEGEEDTETDNEETGDDEGNSNNELKDLENKVFDISPIGLDVRDKTLKKNYLELYNSINNILDKIRQVPKTSINISVIEFCNKKLYELKSICYDYLLYTYSDKTYIENQKNYITYLGIIANINNLLIQIQPKME